MGEAAQPGRRANYAILSGIMCTLSAKLPFGCHPRSRRLLVINPTAIRFPRLLRDMHTGRDPNRRSKSLILTGRPL
jgi:hypothetical protein